MKKTANYLYFIVMAGLFFWFAYTKGWILANFEQIEPEQAITLIQKDNNSTLIDVRTPEEYKEGHLQGAILVPLSTLKKGLGPVEAFRDKKLLVYCKSGMRSVAASRILEKNGFTPVNIKGGIIGLMKANAPIEK